jgi:hypothetical protein
MKLSDKAQAALNQVVEQFKSGDLSPVVRLARIRLPEDAPSSRWTFSNRVLAYAQTGSVDCRGYRQWQAIGRQVQKGSHAAYILGPILVTKETERGEEKQLVGFRAIPVFAYQDTEARNGQALDYAPRELPPLLEVARRLGVKVSYAPTKPGRLGNCKTDGSRITLGSEDPAVFFHELAHAAHKRVRGQALRGGQDAHQETAAELAAAALMHLYGLGDRTGNCWRYVQQYNEDPLRAIMKASDEVGKVLALLLDGEAAQRTASDRAVAESAGNPAYQTVEYATITKEEDTMEAQLTKEMMDALARPFPAEAIQWKPGATNKDRTRGLALAYVDLRHYIDRLNEVAGIDWSDDYEVQEAGKVVLCRLTIAGVTRCDVGEAAPNEQNTATTALAQAFKRACVKFGMGAYLYRLPRMWVEYDFQRKCFTDAALTRLQRAISTGNGHGNGNGAHVPMTVPAGEYAGKTLAWLLDHDRAYLARIANGANDAALRDAAQALLN